MLIRRTSVKRIADSLQIPLASATIVKGLIAGKITVEGNSLFPATNKWIDRCYHTPALYEQVLSALDEILGTFGVECVEIDKEHLYYCNTGDTYETTILYHSGSLSCYTRDLKYGEYRIGSWGDVAEREVRNEN
jgi:hypothetical protein